MDNSIIAFFVGSVTFVLMMGIKIPIKKVTRILSLRQVDYEGYRETYRKRLNLSIIVITFIVAIVCYYFVLLWLGDDHFKLCCSFKAGAIATALYVLYEQWFG